MDCYLASSVMNIDLYKKVDNFDDTRGKSSFFSRVTSRSALVESKTSSILYYERIVIQNDFSEEEFREPINCSQLSYNNQHQKFSHVNRMIDLVLFQGL